MSKILFLKLIIFIQFFMPRGDFLPPLIHLYIMPTVLILMLVTYCTLYGGQEKILKYIFTLVFFSVLIILFLDAPYLSDLSYLIALFLIFIYALLFKSFMKLFVEDYTLISSFVKAYFSGILTCVHSPA